MLSSFDRRTHEDPSLHLIGGSLPIPGTPATIGTLYAGISETPARSDHVHGITVPTWTDVTFNTGWTNYGGSFTNTSYTKDALGWVHIRGLVVGANARAANIIFNLPVGFRPITTREAMPASYYENPNYKATYVQCETNGDFMCFPLPLTLIDIVFIATNFYAG